MIIIKKNSPELKNAINTASKFIKRTFKEEMIETKTTRAYAIESLKQRNAFVNLIDGIYVINATQEVIEIHL